MPLDLFQNSLGFRTHASNFSAPYGSDKRHNINRFRPALFFDAQFFLRQNRDQSIFKNFVAADVSRRKLNRAGIRWRELTFAATDLLKPH